MNEDRIHALSCWHGPVSVEPLPGGITNRNYRVRDGNLSYVVRLCEEKRYLGIDRHSERACQEAAFRVGVAPEVVHSDDGLLVSRFIEARTLTLDDLQDQTVLARLGTELRELHDARHELVGEMLYFCPFQTVRTYLATARRLRARVPYGIEAHVADSQRLAHQMAAFHPTLCHNDLLPANIIDDRARLWLVDWEYAAIGNPAFDLASVSSNAQLTDELEEVLLEAYAESDKKRLRHDVRMLKTVSLLREALWAVIQTVTSDIEFDYDKYAADNLAAYEQARRALELGDDGP